MENLTNTSLRGYRIQEVLGTGGFGIVYRAYQPVINREVAIKAILPEYANAPEFVRRFEREAQYIARLEHLHIVPIYDFWRDPTGAYLVMRYYKGKNLGSSLFNNGPWSLEQASRLIQQIGAALETAHNANIIHQDIKPENILLDEADNGYLTDFGIAKDLSNAADAGYEVYGSPAFISPEHARGNEATKASDIYSFGLVAYATLIGASPFQHANVAKMLAHAKHAPVPSLAMQRPGLDSSLDAIIQRATNKDPEQRYESALQFAEDVAGALTISQDIPLRGKVKPIDGISDTIPKPGSGGTDTQQFDTGSRTQPIDHPVYATPPLVLGEDDIPTSDSGTIKIESITPPPPDPFATISNPYVGLRAFEEVDAYNFHGRTALIQQLVDRLSESGRFGRFLAVIGASGSGKSSVVRAGLIPAVRYGVIDGSERWFISTMTPGESPIKDLEQAILRAAYRSYGASLDETMRQHETGLHEMLSEIFAGEQLFLFIDQFEELFVLADEMERKVFLDNLVHAVVTPDSRLRVILTMRADFYDRPLLIPGFGDLIRNRTEVVLPLNHDELREAVEAPAQSVGLRITSGLVDSIVRDIAKQPGALPLLQFALTELFERRDRDELSEIAYLEMGGVSGALAQRADELYEQLTPKQQQLTRQIFLRLVAIGVEGAEDTRRRALQSTLLNIDTDNESITDILNLFGRYRLLTFDRDPESRTPTVEIAHEALIKAWDRLKDWLDSSRDDLRVQSRLQEALKEWRANNKDESFLARGSRLVQFEALVNTAEIPISQEERAYVESSVKLRERAANRVKAFIGVLIAVTVLAIAMAAFALSQQAAAIRERDRANEQTRISRSRELAASALDTRNRYDTALLLNVAALYQADTIEARSSLLTNLRRNNDVVRLFTHESGGIRAADIDVNTNRLVTGGDDDHIYLWDINGGDPTTIEAHDATIHDIAFSPDGEWIASASMDGTLKLVNAIDEGEATTLIDQTAEIRSVAFHPDGDIIAAGDDDGLIHIRDMTDESIKITLSGHGERIYATAFSPDGKILATAGEDQRIFLWEVDDILNESEPVPTILSGHENRILTLAFSENILASSGAEGAVLLWNPATGDLLGQFNTGHEDWVWDIAFSPQGTVLATASADNTLKLWDLSTGQPLGSTRTGHINAIRRVLFTSEGSQLVTGSLDGSAILWDINPASRIGTPLRDHTEWVNTVAFGEGVIVSGGGDAARDAEDFDIRLWDSNTGELVNKLTAHSAPVTALAVGENTLSGSADGEIIVWTPDGERLATLNEHTVAVVGLAWHEERFISAGDNGVLILWEQEGDIWQPDRTYFARIESGITTIAGDTVENILAVGSINGTIILIDLEAGEHRMTIESSLNHVESLDFSPDGEMLAVGSRDNIVTLWDVDTGQQIGQPLEFHIEWVRDVDFSPDGNTLASASRDGTVLLWDVKSRQPIRPALTGHVSWANTLAFSPDGSQLVSGGSEGDIILWDSSLESWQTEACTVANRTFSAAEWSSYFEDLQYEALCP